ncbi:Cytochrome c oxidase assembly protein cox18, mitochondrial [Nowakowskiella sp. JEL0407]|nr:Cytochrome c oxidase assembly protein cox18, mitochondrial [Nowakowskiella sp. JEL0407]
MAHESSPWNPVALSTRLLSFVHSDLSLPWYLSIISSTLLLRTTITFPIALIQRNRVDRLRSLSAILKAWESSYRKQVLRNPIPDALREKELNRLYSLKTKQLFKQYNCQPYQTFILPWTQIPLFLCMSLSLRKMAAYPVPFTWLVGENPLFPVDGFTTGGVAWFLDLTVADGLLVFPFVLGFSNFLNVEINRFGIPLTSNQKIVHNFFRVLALSMIPLAAQMPMGVTLYWTTSSLFSLWQNIYFITRTNKD